MEERKGECSGESRTHGLSRELKFFFPFILHPGGISSPSFQVCVYVQNAVMRQCVFVTDFTVRCKLPEEG